MESKSEKSKSEVYQKIRKIRVWLLVGWPVLGILLSPYIWYASSRVEAQPLGTLLTNIYSFFSNIVFMTMLLLNLMSKRLTRQNSENDPQEYQKIRVWLMRVWIVLGGTLLLFIWYGSYHVGAQPLGTFLVRAYCSDSIFVFIAILVLKWMANWETQQFSGNVQQ